MNEEILTYLAALALLILYNTILWTIGTRDRLRTLKALHKLLHYLKVPNGEMAENTQKGGD